MSWRDKAKAVLGAGDNRDNRDKSVPPPPSDPIVPNVPTLTGDPAVVLRSWHAHLTKALRDCGGEARDWQMLVTDASWLYETHASYAVRNGWSAQSLFGIDCTNPDCGGLAQRLRGFRTLDFDGPRAVFRRFGVQFKVNAAIGQGLPLLWELRR